MECLIASNAVIDNYLYIIPYRTTCICAVNLKSWMIEKFYYIDDFNNLRWKVFLIDNLIICCGLDNSVVYVFDFELVQKGKYRGPYDAFSDAFYLGDKIVFVPINYEDSMKCFCIDKMQFQNEELWSNESKKLALIGNIKKRQQVGNKFCSLNNNRRIVGLDMPYMKMNIVYEQKGVGIIDYIFMNDQLCIVKNDMPNSVIYANNMVEAVNLGDDFGIRKLLLANDVLFVEGRDNIAIIDGCVQILCTKKGCRSPFFNNTFVEWNQEIIVMPWNSDSFIQYDKAKKIVNFRKLDCSAVCFATSGVVYEKTGGCTLNDYFSYI